MPVLGVLKIMETWCLNHVLGLSLSVLLLGLPGPLGAGTPGNNSTVSLTAGFYYSAASEELQDVENNATSTSYSSESLSPSQRNILLTHSAETHTAAAGTLGEFLSLRPAVASATSGKNFVLQAEFTSITPFKALFNLQSKGFINV